ncbi:MAG TPA: creatininase family protein, partial [Pirellulales bacterium]
MRPWKLAETNYANVKAQSFEVAVLPLGATEPHNLHLPYGTDIFEADLVGEQICAAAH